MQVVMHVFKRKYSQLEILIGAAFFSLSFYCNSQNSNRDTKVIGPVEKANKIYKY